MVFSPNALQFQKEEYQLKGEKVGYEKKISGFGHKSSPAFLHSAVRMERNSSTLCHYN